MLHIQYSNKIEILYERLKQNLFQNSHPFEKRLIVVPTPAIKSWLTLKMAEDKELEIAFGIEIQYLEETLKKLMLKNTTIQKYYPSNMEVAFCIENFLRDTLKKWELLSDTQKFIWKDLLKYLKIDPKETFISKKSEKRFILFTHQTAKLFAEYAQFGQKMLETWINPNHFEHLLWNHLFNGDLNLSYPSLEYKNVDASYFENLKNQQIHLFSISFISQSDHLFLENLSFFKPVFYYIISPCHQYWTDVLSDKESHRLTKFWKDKNVSSDELFQLEDYLNDKNSLLANFGKLNRKMLEMLEKKDYLVEDEYVVPKFLFDISQYDDLLVDHYLVDHNQTSLNLLHAIQSDIFLLRNPSHQDRLLVEGSKTVSLHSSPTKRREIEILYHNLLELIDTNGEDIYASDIIVMAPDITEYVPYIKHYFGNHSALDFQILDELDSLKKQTLSHFFHFLSLPFGKWTVKDFFKLFNMESFKKINHFSEEEILTIKAWFKKVNILWGQTPDHRDDLLKMRYHKEMLDLSHHGTFEDGFSKLIAKLITTDLIEDDLTIDSSQSILLGKCIALMRNLKKDFTPLVDKTVKTYGNWALFIKDLTKKYLFENSMDLDLIFNEVIMGSKWIEEEVSFNCFKNHCEIISNTQTRSYKENHLNAVSFFSITSARSLPAKVVYLIGMEEGSFPRVEKPSSFNLMQNNVTCDYKPSTMDFDRYLFLEAIISARKYLMISYTKYANDGKEQSPALLVTELLNYIDTSFKSATANFFEAIIFHHPFNSFDHQYFSCKEGFYNHSREDYSRAKSFYHFKKADPHQFLSCFSKEYKTNLNENCRIDIRHLKSGIQNPLKSYFNNKLNIWIGEENLTKTEENFDINALELHKLRQFSLKNNLSETISRSEKKGILPFGLLKDVAVNKIKSTFENYQNTLELLNINRNDIFDIVLGEQFENILLENGLLTLPPLEIELNSVIIKIVGKISDICPMGMIAHVDQKSDPVKIWVEFVILNCLIDNYNLKIQKQVLGTKKALVKSITLENPMIELCKLIDYYLSTKTEISPLNAEWLQELIEKDANSFSKFLEDKLTNTFTPNYNMYVNWVNRTSLINSQEMIENGKEKAKDLFSNLYNEWSKK